MSSLHLTTEQEPFALANQFLPITQIAIGLGISERQARRIVDKLPPSDLAGTRPVKVRWGAVCPAALSEVSGNVRQCPDTMSEAPEDIAPIGTETPQNPVRSMSEASGNVRQRPDTMSGVGAPLVGALPDSQYEALVSTLEILKQQLAEKDRQIAQLLAQSENEQKLRAMDAGRPTPPMIEAPRRTWWDRLLGKGKQQ